MATCFSPTLCSRPFQKSANWPRPTPRSRPWPWLSHKNEFIQDGLGEVLWPVCHHFRVIGWENKSGKNMGLALSRRSVIDCLEWIGLYLYLDVFAFVGKNGNSMLENFCLNSIKSKTYLLMNNCLSIINYKDQSIDQFTNDSSWLICFVSFITNQFVWKMLFISSASSILCSFKAPAAVAADGFLPKNLIFLLSSLVNLGWT